MNNNFSLVFKNKSNPKNKMNFKFDNNGSDTKISLPLGNC